MSQAAAQEETLPFFTSEPMRAEASNAVVKRRGLAAVLLVTMLEQFGMCRSRVRGGSGEDGFGARLPTGEMRGHYWVEAALEDEEVYTVDVTADQFGFGTVVILDAESSLLRYRAGPQEEVEEAAMDLAAELGAGDLFQKSRCRWETKSGSPERQLKWVRG